MKCLHTHSARLVAIAAAAALALTVVLGAAPATAGVSLVAGSDVQANSPQVAGDPASDSNAVFPTNKSNEPTVAVNPLDRRHLIGGANDEQHQPACGPGPVRGATIGSDCSFFPRVGTSGVYTSADGGTTWVNRGLLDDQASWRGAGVVSDGDPVIAYGPKPDGAGRFSWTNGARVYYSSLASIPSLKGFEFIVVAYSDDDGLTWSAPVVATTKTSSVDFNDKGWIGVDTSTSSAFFGRVYLSWTEFRSAGNGSEPVMIASSPDGGRRFAAPTQLSPAGNNGTGNGRQGSSIAVSPDGSIYVAFEQGASQVVTLSRDGGSRWTRPAAAGPVADITDPIPGANFRTDSFPVIAADPRPSSRTLYLAWVTRTAAGGRVVVATSNDRGASWHPPTRVSGGEGYAFFPGLAITGDGRPVIAYQVLNAIDPTRFGTGNARIDAYATTGTAASTSAAVGGAGTKGGWSAPVRLNKVSSDPAASAQNNLQRQFWGDYNTLTAAGNTAWFAWTDSRGGTGCVAVDAYQKYLVDNGLVIRDDGADRLTQATTGINPALSDPSVKPAPGLDCPAQFGNTDTYVTSFTP